MVNFNKVLLLMFLLTLDHYTLAENESMVISSKNIFHTLPCDAEKLSASPILTFDAPSGFRIKCTFGLFIFNRSNEYLEIGNGLFSGEETRLVRFSGADKPSEVVSVSNVAWLRVKSNCKRKIPDFNVTISAVADTGIHYSENH